MVLVTHDNRILDVADRILHLEDGEIQSISEAVSANTSQMLRLLDQHMNYRDMAHGGVLSTFADVAMSWQVYCSEEPPLPVSTITLAVNFLGPARLGDWLVADMRIDRKGRQVAYCSGQIRRGEDVLATASASFALMRPKT